MALAEASAEKVWKATGPLLKIKRLNRRLFVSLIHEDELGTWKAPRKSKRELEEDTATASLSDEGEEDYDNSDASSSSSLHVRKEDAKSNIKDESTELKTLMS